MNKQKNTMAVEANHFSLYEAFKKEVESLGWTYNSEFVEFSNSNAFGYRNCLFFSYDFKAMKGKPAFALSCTDSATFKLESQFSEALDMAKQIIENHKIKTFMLYSLYTADIDPKEKTVTVGCQVFSFDTVRELTDLVNELELLEMDDFITKNFGVKK